MKKSIWRNKFKTLKDYYLANYDQDFYEFDKYQSEIDPDETPEEVAQYWPERQAEEIQKCVESFPYFLPKIYKNLTSNKRSHTIRFIQVTNQDASENTKITDSQL